MCSVIKDEFRLRNFGLNYDQPEHFTSSQCKCPRLLFLLFRLVLCGYSLYSFIYACILGNDKIMIYLTIWTYLVLTTHFLLSFIMIIVSFFTSGKKTEPTLTSATYHNAAFTNDNGLVKEKNKSVTFDHNGKDVEKGVENKMEVSTVSSTFASTVGSTNSKGATMPWYYKIDWVLVNIVSVVDIVVTVVFFTALFKPDNGVPLNDVNVHILNAVLIIVDNFISARPTRLLHVIYPIIYGTVYVVFSTIYWGVDNTNVIYPVVLDWNNPGTTVGVVFGILAFICIIQILTFALYRLRLFIYNQCCSK